MKREEAIRGRLLILKGEVRDLNHKAYVQAQLRAYGEAAKYMQRGC
jgi:hypothetical protein